MEENEFILRVTPTQGPASEYRLWPRETASCGAFTAVLTAENGVYGLVLQAKEAAVLRALDLQIGLPASLWDENLYFYSNGDYTNEITGVKRWCEHRDDRIRDLVLLKNKRDDAGFAAGYVTAHRFYADIAFAENTLSLHTEMEDKALCPGESYRLERFVLAAPGETTEAFLARYGETVALENGAVPLTEIPTGWCSWSCYYSNVNEEKISRAARGLCEYLPGRQPNLVQIDDGWQKCGSFPGLYETDPAKFPHGLDATGDAVRGKGMTFGLWLAPLLISEKAERYEELKSLVNTSVEVLNADGVPVHPFCYDAPGFYELLTRTFTELRHKHDIRYFKLDFLAASFRRFVGDKTLVFSRSDYCVALFRKALETIRRAVGPDTALLSCGSPILECAGIFNAARVSCDIIWGKGKELPTYWEIMQGTVKTTLYRYFYHQRVFTNDPDGLVLRDEEKGDGFDCTYSEARLWATAVAVSGGSVLVNEELERLSPARRALFTRLLPPLGIAGRPCDYFETPAPSLAVIDADRDVRFAASFHWDDKRDDADLPVARFGFDRALAVRCWDGTVLGVTDCLHERCRQPHSAELYLLRRVPDKACFLYSDVNLFGGVGLYEASLENGRWHVTASPKVCDLHPALYGWVPEGLKPVGEVTARVPGGCVVKIPD